MTLNSILVAAGFDQTLTDNDNIENFTPNVGNPQQFKAGKGGMVYFAVSEREYSEGQARFDPNAAETFVGSEQIIYVQPGCHPDSYAWLVANRRGQVTCQITKRGTTYTQHNARLRFEASPSSARIGWYQVRWIFTIVEDL